MYTCQDDEAYIKYGAFSASDANIKEGEKIRKIATTNERSWAVYTQQILFNDAAIWNHNGGLIEK